MDVKFLKGLKENLKNVAIVNGQILFTTDSKEIFIDVGTERLEIADTDVLAGNLATLITLVGNLPEDATADTIVDYINEKFAALALRVTSTEGDIQGLKSADEAITEDLRQAEGDIDTLQSHAETLFERLGTAEDDIDTLEGKVEALEIDAEKHADKIYVDEELAKKAAQADFEALKKVVDDFFAEDAAVNDVIDTLKEIATYIANDKEGAADMAARIGALETKVDVEKVSEAIATAKQEAIDTANAASAELDAVVLAEAQKYADEKVTGLVDGDIAAIKEALTWGTF